MAPLLCPICRRSFESSSSAVLPFCGDRCRLVDLNRWLSEDYPFPSQRRNDDEDEDPASGAEPDES